MAPPSADTRPLAELLKAAPIPYDRARADFNLAELEARAKTARPGRPPGAPDSRQRPRDASRRFRLVAVSHRTVPAQSAQPSRLPDHAAGSVPASACCLPIRRRPSPPSRSTTPCASCARPSSASRFSPRWRISAKSGARPKRPPLFPTAPPRLLNYAIRVLLSKAAARGQFRPRDPAAPERGSGYIVLGMGKHGARELNYSSDIDLIVFYDPRRAPPRRRASSPEPFFVRLTRDLVRLMQERTGDGYVFRTDLRLRPDPGSTQAALSIDRRVSAITRASARTGSARPSSRRAPWPATSQCGETFLTGMAPYIWRKYLDFAAIADIHAMKRQIHAFKGHASIAIAGP